MTETYKTWPNSKIKENFEQKCSDIQAFLEVIRLVATSKIKIATGRPAWCLESRLAAGFLQGSSQRAGKFQALQGPSRNFCI
jgi:hypothetical protein